MAIKSYMFNPNNTEDNNFLRQVVLYSYEQLRSFREQRIRIIKQYAGRNYGQQGAESPLPLNLINMFVDIYASQMVSRNPRCFITTKVKELRPAAYAFSEAMNQLGEEVELSKTLHAAVVEMLMSGIGIVKVALDKYAEVEINGYLHDVGQPYCDGVTLDNWVHDVTAERFEQCQFFGNFYKVPYEYVMESKYYDKKAKEGLQPTSLTNIGPMGDQKATALTQNGSPYPGELKSTIELCDMWFPLENLVVTYPKEKFSKPLRVIPWEGPETGPFEMLCASPVPSNTMPLAPALRMIDLHIIVNRLYNKLAQQGLRAKSIPIFDSMSADDMERLKDAKDGVATLVNRAQGTQEVDFGRVNQQVFALMMQFKNDFSWAGGNLDSLGGLSANSPTATQDQQLLMSALKQMSVLQGSFIDFTRKVMKKLAFYEWENPVRERDITLKVPKVNINIDTKFGPQDKAGKFPQYQINIYPYSMQDITPAMKLQQLDQTMQGVILPLAPLLQAQGIGINIEAYLKLRSQYADMPEIEDLIMPMQPPEEAQGGSHERTMPGNTKRTVERDTRSTATRLGQDRESIQRMMAGGE